LERRLMGNYRHEQRRFEFLGGRLALKRALLETDGSAVRIGTTAPLPEPFLPAAQVMQILPDPAGRPRLWVENAVTPTQVSIAHAAGWAGAACSDLPIGLDIVDVDASATIPDDLPWLADVEPAWRSRLRALLWGLNECLLKADQLPAKTLWALDRFDTVPTCPADDLIARWPRLCGLAHFEVEIAEQLLGGAFVPLSRSALMVVILLSDRKQSEVH
jgi:hypothetical protein